MSWAAAAPTWRHVPTGVFALDMALHGGVPRSQVTLLFGRESSGKSTVALRTIGSAQRLFPDEAAVLIDVEGTFSKEWARCHGVDPDQLLLVRPETGEMALDVADELVRTPGVSVVVLDSVAALVPTKEVEGSHEDSLPGLHARLVNQFMRKAVSGIVSMRRRGHHPAVVVLNQWRTSIGTFRGDPRVLPGGQAQHYVAFAKVEVLCKEHEGKDDQDRSTVDHNQHSFKVVKNKEGVGVRHGEFTMVRNPSHPLGQGFIDDGRTVATAARNAGLITGGSPKYRLEGVDRDFRVLDEMVEWLYSEPEFYHDLQHHLVGLYRQQNGLSGEGWL